MVPQLLLTRVNPVEICRAVVRAHMRLICLSPNASFAPRQRLMGVVACIEACATSSIFFRSACCRYHLIVRNALLAADIQSSLYSHALAHGHPKICQSSRGLLDSTARVGCQTATVTPCGVSNQCGSDYLGPFQPARSFASLMHIFKHRVHKPDSTLFVIIFRLTYATFSITHIRSHADTRPHAHTRTR